MSSHSIPPSSDATEPARAPSPDLCPNCEGSLHGEFCSTCGQRRPTRIALDTVVAGLKEQIAGLDFHWLHTIRSLWCSPGAMLRDYLRGRRAPFTHPVKLLFLSATLYLVVVSLLGVEVSRDAATQRTATAVVALINYLVFLLLVPVAWLLRRLFASSGINWAESYVVLCYLWSGYLLLACLLAVVLLPFPGGFMAARTGLGILYVTIALRSFFGCSWPASALKSLALFAGYFLTTFSILSAVLLAAHGLGFEGLPLGRPS